MAIKGFIKFAIAKVAGAAVTSFALICTTFFIFRTLPGDPVRLLFADPRANPEDIQRMYERFGLDKPLWEQFFVFLRQLFLHGDLGLSFWQKRPVLDVLADRIPQTLLLMFTAILIGLVLGILFGAISGWKTGTKVDSFLVSLGLATYGFPTFCLGILLLLVFSVHLGIFPLGGMQTIGADLTGFAYLWDIARHLVLPAITLCAWYLGAYLLLMRNALQDVLGQDYITSARAKGVKESAVLRKHGLRNAMLPVVTVTGVYVAFAIGGAIQAEMVFRWPGVGLLLYQSVMHRDYPVLQGAFMIIAVLVVSANLVVDLIYGYIDPRIKVGGGK